MRPSTLWVTTALALIVLAQPVAAQEKQREVHGGYSRTTVSHSNAWGAADSTR